MSILSVFTDASCFTREENKFFRIGYTMFVENRLVYEFFSDNIHVNKEYTSLHGEALAIIHAINTITSHKTNISHFNIHHVCITSDCKAVSSFIKDAGLNDFLKILEKEKVSIVIRHKSRNNPRIKYVDNNLRY